jgi:hypothetical protein
MAAMVSGRLRREFGAAFPEFFDGGLQVMGHATVSG